MREKLIEFKEVNNVIYYKNLKGNVHNLEGPAAIYNNGCKSYWINGKWYGDNFIEYIQDVIKYKKENK